MKRSLSRREFRAIIRGKSNILHGNVYIRNPKVANKRIERQKQREISQWLKDGEL